MNASTIILGGGGGMSLPLLDAPKPLGKLRVGPTIWKIWASIKHTFISVFSQAEHVRRKTQIWKKIQIGATAIIWKQEVHALNSRLRGFMILMFIPIQKLEATWYPTQNQKLRLSRLEECGTWFCSGGWILNLNTRAPKILKFYQQLSKVMKHLVGIKKLI
jgi:hypothetical protein